MSSHMHMCIYDDLDSGSLTLILLVGSLDSLLAAGGLGKITMASNDHDICDDYDIFDD